MEGATACIDRQFKDDAGEHPGGDPVEKARAQAEISPAVALLVVLVVLCMAVGLVMYFLQHGPIETIAGGGLMRSRAISPVSRGASDAQAHQPREHVGTQAISPTR